MVENTSSNSSKISDYKNSKKESAESLAHNSTYKSSLTHARNEKNYRRFNSIIYVKIEVN